MLFLADVQADVVAIGLEPVDCLDGHEARAVDRRRPAPAMFVWSYPGDVHEPDSWLDADAFLAEQQRHAPASWGSLALLFASALLIAEGAPWW